MNGNDLDSDLGYFKDIDISEDGRDDYGNNNKHHETERNKIIDNKRKNLMDENNANQEEDASLFSIKK